MERRLLLRGPKVILNIWGQSGFLEQRLSKNSSSSIRSGSSKPLWILLEWRLLIGALLAPLELKFFYRASLAPFGAQTPFGATLKQRHFIGASLALIRGGDSNGAPLTPLGAETPYGALLTPLERRLGALLAPQKRGLPKEIFLLLESN